MIGSALVRWYLQWSKRPPTTCVCHTDHSSDNEGGRKTVVCGMCELPFVVNENISSRPRPSWLLQHAQQQSLVFSGKFMIRLLSMTKL